MARILGLDLGAFSVKAVVFEGSARGYRAVAARELRRPAGTEPAAGLGQVLAELAADSDLAADQTVVSVPGASLATHAIHLPFSEPKKIEAALGFEVESQLPFDLSEAVYDYQPVSASPGQAELLVGVLRREELRALLTLLREHGFDPRVVTHAAMALQNFWLNATDLFADVPAGQAVALVDIGHERTHVAVGRAGMPAEFVRTFAAGGRDLTRALAGEFKVSADDAGVWKEQNGNLSVAPGAPAEAERARAALLRGMQGIYRELRPTLKAYAARSRHVVGRVFVCGGSARLLGLCEQWTRDLTLPVQLLRLPAEAEPAVPLADHPTFAQAYALALRGQAVGPRAPRFNLRRGEFAFKSDFDYVREKAATLAAMAGALLAMLIASGVVRNTILSQREQQVDAMLCETTQKLIGTCEKNYDRALNLLRGKESPAAVVPKISAVGLFGELTAKVPSDVAVTFDQMVIDLDRVTLRGEIDSPKNLDTVAGALRSHRCFKDVKEGKVEKSRDGQKTTFRLDIQVDCSPKVVPQG